MAKTFQTLPGFRDFYPDECAARNYLFSVWRTIARRYGLVEYEGPVLEPTDLYRRKSGDEIVNQLFCFEDKGERDVSMRPELTPTLARMAAARQRDFKKPLRWFSIGQFFRYEKHQKGRGREFYQFNCDLLGESNSAADAELMALAIDLMRELGFTKEQFRLRISDRKAWVTFAESKGIEEEQLTPFLQIIDRMERTPDQKLEELLAPYNLGKRDIEEHIRSAEKASENLEGILEDLSSRGLSEYVEVDLSIVRGLAYYTGSVFEIFDIGKGMRAIAGGGRYDELIGLIGGVEMPACGFAMGDMVITDLIRETAEPAAKLLSAVEKSQASDISVIIAEERNRPEAIALIQELREAGLRVTYSLTPAKVGKQFQAAELAKATYAVVVGSEYPTVTLKSLEERRESQCDRSDLVKTLKA
ncbi:MAG: histidine--tRNA ligase [Verrucomicrobiota bacterium]